MIKFPYVEDYIEIISGDRTLPGHKIKILPESPINLARYDIDIVMSMGVQLQSGLPLTVRQGTLACKIILKYQRQLTLLGVDVTPVNDPQWRLPLRVIDYSCRLFIDHDLINIKFPYDSELIQQLRKFNTDSQGRCQWNTQRKIWEAALTEYNLSWLITWAKNHSFDIDPEVEKLFSLITTIEANEYKICLVIQDNELTITNCPDSLRNYIEQNLGGFAIDNLIRLVDYSSILGYEVDEDILSALTVEYGSKFCEILTSRELKIQPNDLLNNLTDLLDYIDRVQRWPCVFFEPDLSQTILTELIERYGDNWSDSGRYIHTIKPITDLTRIPMVVTTVGLIFSGDRQLMLQRAEKIVYCAVDVYNKSKSRQARKVKTIGV